MRSVETHHWHVAFVQPIQITQGSAQVELKVEVRWDRISAVVVDVVGHAELERTCLSRGIPVVGCIGVSVHVRKAAADLNSTAVRSSSDRASIDVLW